MEPGDDELMQEVKKGDIRAFDLLVRRWEHRLFSLIYRIIGDFETAEDIRQEVFIQVHQAARRYQSINHFKTWLYRVAINRSINELKKRERRRTFPLAILHGHKDGKQQLMENILPDPGPQPDEMIQRNETADRIRGALCRLPDEQRIVIVLRHFDGLKFRQIASILDCPLGTVKSRVRLGLEQLHRMLTDFR